MEEKGFPFQAANTNKNRSDWSVEQVSHLIDMYRGRPVLWDTRLCEHKDRDMRHDALMDLANAFGVSKEEIERKIKNLLSHFAREMKKEQAAYEENVCHKSKWLYYDQLQFLKQRKRRKGCLESEFLKTESEDDFDVVLLPDYDEPEPETSLQAPPPPEPVEMSRMFLTEDNKSFVATSLPPVSPEQEALSIMREIRARQDDHDRDEHTLFGEQIAMKLRKLTSPHARFMVQHIINTTLFEAEMGKYDNPSKTPFNMHTLPPGAQSKKNCL